MLTVEVKGIREVNQRLKLLADEIQRRILVSSMKSAMEGMKTEAETRAPVGQNIERNTGKPGQLSRYRYSHRGGGLKRSFRLRKTRSLNPFLLEVRLENTAFYALWVEYGHKVVKGRGRRKRVVGHTAPRPFMRSTFESQKMLVVDRVAAEIDRRLTLRGV